MTSCPCCGHEVGDSALLFDFDHRRVIGNGEVTDLPFLECEILRYLHKHSPDSVTGAALDWHVFKSLDVDAKNNIKQYVSRLRQHESLAKQGVEIHCTNGRSQGRENTLYWLTW